MSDIPTTIYVPSCCNPDEDGFYDDDRVTSDDDDLSLTREMVRSHCRAAPESRRAPPRTVSLESSRQGPPRRTFSTSSESPLQQRRTPPMRTVSSDSFRSPVHLMATLTLDSTICSPRRSLSTPASPRLVSPGGGGGGGGGGRESSICSSTLQQPSAAAVNPLDQMYREGLKKLARSMKHSDMTRNMIKRQSLSKFSYRTTSRGNSSVAIGINTAVPAPPPTPLYLYKQKEFFLSSRCKEVEQCRRQLFDMIQESQG